MTKHDIVELGGNPELIEWLCDAMILEVHKDEFSLKYLYEKAYRLLTYLDKLGQSN
jgi:hypothetical protein